MIFKEQLGFFKELMVKLDIFIKNLYEREERRDQEPDKKQQEKNISTAFIKERLETIGERIEKIYEILNSSEIEMLEDDQEEINISDDTEFLILGPNEIKLPLVFDIESFLKKKEELENESKEGRKGYRLGEEIKRRIQIDKEKGLDESNSRKEWDDNLRSSNEEITTTIQKEIDKVNLKTSIQENVVNMKGTVLASLSKIQTLDGLEIHNAFYFQPQYVGEAVDLFPPTFTHLKEIYPDKLGIISDIELEFLSIFYVFQALKVRGMTSVFSYRTALKKLVEVLTIIDELIQKN